MPGAFGPAGMLMAPAGEGEESSWGQRQSALWVGSCFWRQRTALVLPLGFRCLTCSLAEVSLSRSNFLASSASLRTADLFLISGGIAKLILYRTALRTFSDISLGAKTASDSLGALTISEELLTGFEGHKFDFNFLNPAILNLFYGSGPQSGIWLQNNSVLESLLHQVACISLRGLMRKKVTKIPNGNVIADEYKKAQTCKLNRAGIQKLDKKTV